ncbi:cationic amino acid transporter 3-like [Anneissia japonica]|uniref:cationic amino acid transporter 3-like n=1 Tax=Anneissia japonica TaxID=1529436 RepID=UPI001425B8E4|nr:cationic amino acid transporter 3-like [Anneissia japonica]
MPLGSSRLKPCFHLQTSVLNANELIIVAGDLDSLILILCSELSSQCIQHTNTRNNMENIRQFGKKLFRVKTFDTQSLHETEFRRCLSILDLTGIGVGSTLGVGAYVLAGQVARDDAGPAIILSFIIAALVSLLSGLCYAEFGARIPKTGSAYLYSYVVVGELIAFVTGWSMIMDNIIAGAGVGKAWSEYLDAMLNLTISETIRSEIGEFQSNWFGDYPDFLAFVLLLIMTAVVAIGVQLSSITMFIFTVINLAVVAFIIIAGAPYANIHNWTSNGGFFPYGFPGVIAGAATCFYAFVGFDVIATSGEETTNPGKAIPLSIILTLVVCTIVYILVSTILTLMVNYKDLALYAPLAQAFSQNGFDAAKYVVAIGSLVALTSSMLGSIFPLPRIIYAISKDGLLFQFLGRVNYRTNVPVNATIVSGLLTACLALVFNLQQLVEMMSIGTLMSYSLVVISTLLLRYKPDHIGLNKQQSSNFNVFPREDSSLIDLGEGLSRRYTNAASPSGDDSDERQLSITTTFADGESDDVQRLVGKNHTFEQQRPSEVTYTKVFWLTIASILLHFAMNSILVFAESEVINGVWWYLFLLAILLTASIICAVFIWRQPQNTMQLAFKAPLIPGLPLLALFCNIHLTLRLTLATWIRFFVWLVVGLLVYFFYGIRHSKESESSGALPAVTRDD